MVELRFDLTLVKLREVCKENIQTQLIITRFKDNLSGYDWRNNFLKRYKSSLKKEGQMQLSRKKCNF